MGELIDMGAWRDGRSADDPDIRRLELVVSRLDEVASARLEEGRLTASVETELLAILGALAADLVEEAIERAERLSKRLATATSVSGRAR